MLKMKWLFCVIAVAGLCAVAAAAYAVFSEIHSAPFSPAACVRIPVTVGSVEVVIESADVLEDAVLRPIRSATYEPMPAAYVLFGDLIVREDERSEKRYTLYIPWGHFSIDGKYYIADFSALEALTTECIKEAQQEIERARLVPE